MPKTLNNSTPSPVSPINRGNTQISCNPVHLFKLKVSLFKLFRQADLSKLLHQYLRCADGFTHARKYLTSFIFLKNFSIVHRWRQVDGDKAGETAVFINPKYNCGIIVDRHI